VSHAWRRGDIEGDVAVQTPSFFNMLAVLETDKSNLASLITDSWNQLLSWLKQVNTLREISGQTAIFAQKT
jgi:hypothetical protein